MKQFLELDNNQQKELLDKKHVTLNNYQLKDLQLASVILEIALYEAKRKDGDIIFPINDFITKIKAICPKK